jgi:hypothetical protein
MPFTNSNAPGKLAIVTACGIGGAPVLRTSAIRGVPPLTALTQTLVHHLPPLRSIQSRRKVDMIAAVAVIGPETRRRASRRILVFRYLLRGVNRDALSRRRHRRYWIPRHARFPRRGHRRLPVEICLRCPLAYVPPGPARRTSSGNENDGFRRIFLLAAHPGEGRLA